MIALDLKQDTPTAATTSLLGVKGEKSEGALSFSALLKGIKSADKTVQNGALVLALDDAEQENTTALKSSKGDLLLSLLGTEELSKDAKLLEINPEVTKALSVEDLKLLIKDAKAYLKEQIVSSEGFKRAEMQKLPKTLKGLVQVAKKIGIDIAKITLEEVRKQGNPLVQQALGNDEEARSKLDLKQETPKQKSASTDFEAVELEIKPKQNKKTIQANSDVVDDLRLQEHAKGQKQVSKETPLFKVQKSADISTEQIVTAKTVNNSAITGMTQKKRSDDTLKLLLQGEKTAKKEGSTLTSDFSVATAKVIAPHAKSEAAKTLESLLQGDSSNDESSVSKTDGLQVAKADSFEVKLNEAKQMIKYLSQDVKQAIDNYKAPFTRVKVQLNPQKLGEVELTVVQRGKNLHVNLSSNNAAINTLAMNANDLKVQLQNNGIQNASLNFNNNSQGGEAANGGQAQHQQQQRQNAQDEYAYFESEEQNEELLSSLEIVVPNYA
ncbi:MAG TPA: flagellar hook-length control protein FliK [Sulfurimonas autotrophica]|uniref:Flagellar hook-length control protein FliK n=1 Tax=Sulfurimonas autotrophica TaxID=202747 RepID=A0A7C3C2S3_9BACT|nr:flagellar hook-length control protein FliK [Sulfurimonas autotrophica]